MRQSYTEEVSKRVLSMTKDWRKEMTPRVREASYGVTRPSKEALAMFMANQLRLMPPEPWLLPNGMTVMVDPWSADLLTGRVDGGRELLRKIAEAGRVL